MPAENNAAARIHTAETLWGTEAIHHTSFALTGETVRVGRSTWQLATKGSEAIAVFCQGGRCFRYVSLAA